MCAAASSRPTRPCKSYDIFPSKTSGFANVDHHRALRVGMPEVIFGPGKDPVASGRDLQSAGQAWQQRAGDPRLAGTDSRGQTEAAQGRSPRARACDHVDARQIHTRQRARSSSSPPAPATFPSRRKRWSRRRSWATTSSMSTTSASPAFIACWPAAMC